MDWTLEQNMAIKEEGQNIIVSAGAGSGKTAVLTARVQRKLLEGTHINQLLILTFTNAAAAEMKDRIRETINSTKELENEKDKIDGAFITTFDSFSLSVLKKYHTRLNITNNINVCEEVVIELKKKELLDEIIDEKYISNDSKFINLIKDFCLKDDKDLKNSILNIYRKLELKYDKNDYLDNYDNIFIKIVDDSVLEFEKLLLTKINNMKDLMADLGNYFDGEYITKVEDNFSKLLNSKNYSDILRGLDYNTRLNAPKGTEDAGKELKAAIFDKAKEIKELCIYESLDEAKEEIISTKDNIDVIIEIIKELDKRLTNYKLSNDLFTFNDIAQMAIKVVEENSDIRWELTNQFKEILVDEYQDTSDIQEKFISLISNNNVYMVGDIKQSIYRFRNANPYIFKEKYDTYRDTDKGLKIDLVQNFRSRDEVLKNINLLFDQFMDDEIGGADYKVSHRMVFGNQLYTKNKIDKQNYNLDIITYCEDDLSGITKDEEEAFIIGNDIKEKYNSKYQVFDKETKSLRNVSYDDFVILLDKSKNFDLYKKIFEYLGIPLTIIKESSLNKDNDILVIKSLLKLIVSIKNGEIDKYSFISVGRSYLSDLDDEEIYEYFVNNNYEESSLYKACLPFIDIIDIMSPAMFLKKLLDEFNYDEKLLTTGNIKSNRVREEYIFQLVSDYEKNGKTIYDFINYLEEIFENDYDLKFNINTSVSNSCKIMTIHKSKGLEYPICYFAGFSSRFNIKELSDKIMFDNKYGFVLSKVDNYYKDTILKILLKEKFKKEEISERIRLLYVALTRAKEKIIMVMPEVEEGILKESIPVYEKIKYNSFLSIMKSIYSSLLPYVKKSDIVISRDYLNDISKDKYESSTSKLDVKELEIENGILEESHFSKDSLHLISSSEEEVMDFGTKVHEVLEFIDFNDPNYEEFDIDDKVKDKVNSFIKSNFMRPYLNCNLYKEYEFIYHEDNMISHGIIDLLIEDKDKMIIVDYKLKNIDDEAYDKQLNGYRKVISEKTNKDTYCYLYSILNEDYREVYND